MPSKTRVYELARELGLENKETLELCKQLGIGVKSHPPPLGAPPPPRAPPTAQREGLIRAAADEDSSGDEADDAADAETDPAPEPAKPKPVSSKKPPPPRRSESAEEAAGKPESATDAPPSEQTPSPEPQGKPVPTSPPPGRRVVTSSGSAGPTRPVRAETPPPPPPREAEAKPKPTPPPGTEAPAAAPAARADAPAAPPTSESGKPIPPPPGPPTSRSGKPIPPPPGPPKSRDAGRPSGPPPGRRAGGPPPGGGAGRGAPTGAPRGPRPGGGPPPGRSGPPGRGGPGGGRGGPPRGPRRKSRRRRRRNIEELQPVDVPTYTPEDAPVPEGEVVVERMSTPQDLGQKMNRTAADVVRFLMQQGEMVTATQSLNDDMIELFAAEIGVEIRLVDPGEEQEVELQELLDIPDDDGEEVEGEDRPPVITVMGHVDHGKTKLLDRIRDADVVAGEAGGITQHIGAYQVHRNDSVLTFIDTPGHEAFTAMRARGAEATDIVVLVVAADDGVMPQTEEAISHARAAEVPIVVAINKVDRESADPNRVMQQLAERDLIPEAWGGDTVTVEVSALQGTGIEELLDSLLLVAELEELTAPEDGRATGVVLESHLDIGRGPVATLLVQRGTLSVGDPVVAGAAWGRARALINDHGENVKVAGPSTPVQVLGLSDVAQAGDEFVVAPTDKVATKVAETREHWQRLSNIGRDAAATSSGAKLEDIFSEIQSGETATLNLIVKADVNGSLEALTESLRKAERDDVKLAFVHRGVGGITENDVQLAAASNATIIGFNVRPDRKARELAEAESVEVRTYEIIYKLIEDIEAALVGMLAPEFEEIVTGEAEVREIFRIRGVGAVAGCYVTDGVVTRGSKVRFLREGTIIWKGEVSSLKRFTEDATEVRAGFECGIGLSDFQDLKQGDVIETFEEREIERT